nr:type I-E CRISPR-associated protein Cas6/Cse3/CasE [Acidipropionibacterium virtanenii]
MSAFARIEGDAPRASMGILWHIDRHRSILTVQSDAPPAHPGLLGDLQRVHEVAIPSAGDELEIKVLLACQKTPPSQVPRALRAQLKARTDGEQPGTPHAPGQGRAYRSRSVTVPEEERAAWLSHVFDRHGLWVEEKTLEVSSLRHANLGKHGRGIPAVEVTTRAIVERAPEFTHALQHGVGKGRTYGLGLLRTRAL